MDFKTEEEKKEFIRQFDYVKAILHLLDEETDIMKLNSHTYAAMLCMLIDGYCAYHEEIDPGKFAQICADMVQEMEEEKGRLSLAQYESTSLN